MCGKIVADLEFGRERKRKDNAEALRTLRERREEEEKEEEEKDLWGPPSSAYVGWPNEEHSQEWLCHKRPQEGWASPAPTKSEEEGGLKPPLHGDAEC